MRRLLNIIIHNTPRKGLSMREGVRKAERETETQRDGVSQRGEKSGSEGNGADECCWSVVLFALQTIHLREY